MTNRRAVLFANGEISSISAIQSFLREDDFLIAVDGGIKHIKSCSRLPDLLVGDLDSIDPVKIEELRNLNVEIHKYSVDKDETDLELAILEALKLGFSELILTGVLGGRLDHTLGNLNLLLLPELKNVNVMIKNGIEEIFLIRKKLEISGHKGDLVSLIPINGNALDVETKDLKYPLCKETLFIEKGRGISNVMLTNHAEVSLASGDLLCIHTCLEE